MKPELAIVSERKQGVFTILEVDTAKATYQGRNWREMGDWGKRKFENWVFITRSNERLKFRYL